MILGIGVDVAQLREMSRVLEDERFLRRVFTSGELADCGGAERPLRLAARFAAKEAFAKALGTGISGGVSWKDIEITGEPESGRPILRATGEAAEMLRERQVVRQHVSLSHAEDVVVAVVVLEAQVA